MIQSPYISAFLEQRTSLYQAIDGAPEFINQVYRAYYLIRRTICYGGKILIFGNGGSAAQAQHFAAELVCQFEKKRRALPAIALTVDSSVLTAQSNDFGFETVFSRQIEALCHFNDLVIGLTTSDYNGGRGDGHSLNIYNAFSAAKKLNAGTVGLFSQKTQNLLFLVDEPIIVPSTDTALIQEVHQTVIHVLCSLVESEL